MENRFYMFLLKTRWSFFPQYNSDLLCSDIVLRRGCWRYHLWHVRSPPQSDQIITHLNMCPCEIWRYISSYIESRSWMTSSLPPSFLQPGIWAQFQIQPSLDVIKGQRVVLSASYSSAPGDDPTANTVVWNFISNSTQLVRKLHIQQTIHLQPISEAIISGITVMKDVC